MNKYKIVSIVLAVALLAVIARLIFVMNQTGSEAQSPKSEVVLQNILSRKSVRSYTDQTVSREQLDTLVRAAMAAPTAKDMRPWKFIVIDEEATMDSLAAKLPRASMLAEAKAAIVVCGDMTVVDDKGEPSRNWMIDCSAATENLLLAAEAMGLGAVWTAVYPYEDRIPLVCEALKLPDHIIPLNIVPIGYPKGDPQPKDKYDKANVHYNQW